MIKPVLELIERANPDLGASMRLTSACLTPGVEEFDARETAGIDLFRRSFA